MAMIRVYESTDTVFDHNGIKSILPKKAVIYKEDNADYYLDLEAGIQYADVLKQDNIIVVDVPWDSGKEAFRLNNPTINNNILKFKAYQLFYDGNRYVIEDCYPQNKNANEAIHYLNQASEPTSPFNVVEGDATELVLNSRYVRKSLSESMLAMAEKYGCSIYRNMYEVGMKASLGTDKEETIRLGKNIKVYKQEENWDNVVTKLMPVGYDGVLLPEKYLYTEMVYDLPYTKVVSFDPSDGVDTEDKEAVINDLRTQAIQYLHENVYPKISYTVEAILRDPCVGDTIQIIHPKISADIYANIIAVQYDSIKNQYKAITFGNYVSGARNTVKIKVLGAIDATNESLKSLAKSTSAKIEVLDEEIELKVDKDGVISAINISPEEIKLLATRISLEGLVTINGEFRINEDGSMECTNARVVNAINKRTYFTDGMYYRYTVTTGEERTVPLVTAANDDVLKLGDADTLIMFPGAVAFSGGVSLNYNTTNVSQNNNAYRLVHAGNVDGLIYSYLSSNGYKPGSGSGGSNVVLSRDLILCTNAPGQIAIGDGNAVGWDYAHRTFSTSSDLRLKYDIQDLENVEDFYMSLKPKTFRFKDGFDKYALNAGLIAQEVQSNIEEHGIESGMVYEAENVLDQGQYCGDGTHYNLKYDDLHAYHIAMIHKQQKEINELRSQMESLVNMLQSKGII